MALSLDSSVVLDIMNEKYQNDTILLVVTAKENVPTVRSVDSFFYEGSFWIVSDLRCNYVQEIQSNENVMISDGGHNRFWCKASVIGHPLETVNAGMREVFLRVFDKWYNEVNNENIKTVCYIKATPYKGYVHKNKQGFSFNIDDNTLSIADVTHHIDVRLEPFWD
jgi:general stress protein 26